MRTLERDGKTVDEAIWNGLQELGLSRDQVRIEILDQGNKGIFGIGARPARVLLMEKEPEEELDIRSILRGQPSETPNEPRQEAPKSQSATGTSKKATPSKPESTATQQSSLVASRREIPVELAPYAGDEPRSEMSQRISEQLQRQQTTLPPRSVEHLKQPRADRSSPPRVSRQEGRSQSRMTAVRPPHDLAAPETGPPTLLHTFLTELFHAMQLPCSVGVVQEESVLQASIYGDGDDLGLLIGKHGATLDALQYLSSLAVNRGSEGHLRVQIQIGDYRQRREDTLTRLANRMAERVLRDGRPQSLEPMLASERRLIHLALQTHPQVETISEGEEPNRYVVVRLRKT